MQPDGTRVAPDGNRDVNRPERRRLGFNEQHALKTLPDRIAALESEIAALHARLADPGLYARDRAGFEAASNTLAERQAALAAAEERWLSLELLREEIEGT
jgi:ATP-binding cassette subfamily F protein uup